MSSEDKQKIKEQGLMDFNNKVDLNKGLVVLDFYADWCAPCKAMLPVVKKVAEETSDCLFYKVNIDEQQEIATKHSVMSIPTMILFEDGEVKGRISGQNTKEEIVNWISMMKKCTN